MISLNQSWHSKVISYTILNKLKNVCSKDNYFQMKSRQMPIREKNIHEVRFGGGWFTWSFSCILCYIWNFESHCQWYHFDFKRDDKRCSMSECFWINFIAFSIPLGAPVGECFTLAVTAQSCVQSVVLMPTFKHSYLA